MTNDGASGIKRKKKQNMREMRIFTKASGQVIFFVSEFSGNLLFRRLLRFDVQFVQNGQRLLLAATSEEKEKRNSIRSNWKDGKPIELQSHSATVVDWIPPLSYSATSKTGALFLSSSSFKWLQGADVSGFFQRPFAFPIFPVASHFPAQSEDVLKLSTKDSVSDVPAVLFPIAQTAAAAAAHCGVCCECRRHRQPAKRRPVCPADVLVNIKLLSVWTTKVSHHTSSHSFYRCAPLSPLPVPYIYPEKERETGASAFRHNAQLSAPRISCSTSLSARFDVDKQTDETLNRFVPTSLFDVTAPATDSASSGYAQENYGNSLRDFFAQLLKGFFFFVFYLCALETLKTWVFKVVSALWRAGSPATSSIAAAACCWLIVAYRARKVYYVVGTRRTLGW